MIIRYHKGNPIFRNKILKEGLTPQIGDSYRLHHENIELKPCIFLYDKEKAEYDSTYDDDIWKVRLNNLESCAPDIDEEMYNTFGAIMCFKKIAPENLTLVYKGTGNPY